MSTVRHVFVCPIYNVIVDNDVLGVDFNDYIIISAAEFHQNYASKLYCRDIGLLDDVKLPIRGAIVERPIAKYMIISYLELEDENEQSVIEANNKKINEFFAGFCFLIMALRWLAPGNIQVNNAYVLSSRSSKRNDFGISTPLPNIRNRYSEGPNSLFFRDYKITRDIMGAAMSLGQTLVDNYQSIEYPAVYFNQYYQTFHLQDKLIKLMTLFETSLMCDSPVEKQYALICRGCFFLNKNIGPILKCAYSLRSEYLHSGDISQKTIKKVKTIVGVEEAWKALFVFITAYLEPIVRQLLNGLLRELIVSRKSINQIDKELDEQIYEKLGAC